MAISGLDDVGLAIKRPGSGAWRGHWRVYLPVVFRQNLPLHYMTVNCYSTALAFFDSINNHPEMTPAQSRAARGLLKWTQDDLARASRVSVVTVRNFENEKSTLQRATEDVIRRALEEAGVEFTNGNQLGVRLRVRP